MIEAVKYLSKLNGKYDRQIGKWKETKNKEIAYELLFAFQMESNNTALKREVQLNAQNPKTVDYQALLLEKSYNFELTRIKTCKGLKEEHKGGEYYGYVLTNESVSRENRTSSQILRLQEKILEKTQKFEGASSNNVNIICIDCSNIMAGMIDEHDIGIATWGKPYEPVYAETWEGTPITGLFEETYNRRYSDILKTKVSGIIFFPKLSFDLFKSCFIVVNPNLENSEKDIIDGLNNLKPFRNYFVCNPPSTFAQQKII